jgi:circadian clock protein KaiC
VNRATRFGENGIYVTFEQLPTQIYRDGQSLGWDLRRLEDENKFRLICTSPNILLEDGGGENILSEPMKEINAERIAVDSLSHLAMYTGHNDLRRELYRLIMFLKAKGLGSLLIWEGSDSPDQSKSSPDGGISFLVDCIVSLKHVEIESKFEKLGLSGRCGAAITTRD